MIAQKGASRDFIDTWSEDQPLRSPARKNGKVRNGSKAGSIHLLPAPDAFRSEAAASQIPQLTELQLLTLSRALLAPSRTGKILKRTLDVTLSLALLGTLSPLIVSVALVLMVHLRGYPFFLHERVGKGGVPFKCIKFRTMKNGVAAKECDGEQRFKTGVVTRTTKLTRLLRKTSVDELPQLINVLRGQMSIVGPRPVVADELACYFGELAPVLLLVKPGMAGLWMVGGRSLVGYPARTLIELTYVMRASLWLDLRILLKTPIAVLTGRGAI